MNPIQPTDKDLLRWGRNLLGLGVALGLLSCVAAPVRQLPLRLRIDPDVNDDSPIALSFLVISDPELAEEISRLTAAQWFDNRKLLLSRDGNALHEVMLEVVPGQEISGLTLDVPAGSCAGLLFTDLRAQSRRGQWFDPNRPVHLAVSLQAVSLLQENP